MNKKYLLIGIATLVVLAAIIVAARPDTTESDRMANPTTEAVNTETPNTTESDKITDSTDEVVPPDTTESDSDATIPTLENGMPAAPGPVENVPETTEDKQEDKEPQQTEPSNVQPEGDETLPPDVNASVGVEQDKDIADLGGNVEDPTENTQATKPTETEPAETKPTETKPTETKPTETKPTETKPTETKPTETKPTETKPTETQPTTPPQTNMGGSSDPLSDNYDLTTLTYEGYLAMTGEQQAAVVNAFSSPDEFIRWYKAAEAQYKKDHPDIEIGGNGSINGGGIG